MVSPEGESMSTLIGEYAHALDDKGRVSIPAKFREELGLVFYITKGMDGCLFVYAPTEWKALEEKINDLKLTRKNARAFARLFFAGASQLSTDKQGRVLIPQNLREYAGLTRDAMIIGVSDRIEIWDKDRWEEYSHSDAFDYDVLTDSFDDIDL